MLLMKATVKPIFFQLNQVPGEEEHDFCHVLLVCIILSISSLPQGTFDSIRNVTGRGVVVVPQDALRPLLRNRTTTRCPLDPAQSAQSHVGVVALAERGRRHPGGVEGARAVGQAQFRAHDDAHVEPAEGLEERPLLHGVAAPVAVGGGHVPGRAGVAVLHAGAVDEALHPAVVARVAREELQRPLVRKVALPVLEGQPVKVGRRRPPLARDLDHGDLPGRDQEGVGGHHGKGVLRPHVHLDPLEIVTDGGIHIHLPWFHVKHDTESVP